jgi:hypothetical protein
MDGYLPLLNKGAQVLEGLLILFFKKADFQLLQGQGSPIVLFRPVEREQRLLVFPNPEGGRIWGPRDNFDEESL